MPKVKAEERPGIFSQALSAYRDVEIAKRSQPRLVQGIQQVESPASRNNNAVVGGVGGVSVADIVPGGSKTLLLVGGGLLAVAAMIMLLRKKRS